MITEVFVLIVIILGISMLIFAPIFGLGSSDVCAGITNTGYKFETRAELDAGITAWIGGDRSTYGDDINTWDVRAVTDMDELFKDKITFNDNIGCWDVSLVTNMSSMFFGATAFNQDIGNWDVSEVTNMSFMFKSAGAFNQDIGGWDVSEVTNMRFMFRRAAAFDQNLSSWSPDAADSSNFENMFNGAFANSQTNATWTGNITFRDALDTVDDTTIANFYSNSNNYVRDAVTPGGTYPILRE